MGFSRFLYHIFVVCTMAFLLGVSGAAAKPKANDIALAKDLPPEKLQELLLAPKEWHPFPKIQERVAWEQVPAALQKSVINQAEAYLDQDIPNLPASLYLEFKRMGNRSRYQNEWYKRRRMLHAFVLAECVENKGRFLDPAANVIWAMCEETSWTWPAHIGPQKAGRGLPDVDDQVVALFSAQTANSMVLADYLLGKKLDTVSPLIRQRIHREIDRRILTPFLEKRFGWMGYGDRERGEHPNNWNPWVCSNVLVSALLAEKDETRRVRLVHKVLDCLDNFLTYYPSDGSCDEGPSYWKRAGGSLFDNLEWLHGASQGKIDYYDHRLIQEIGRFIYRAHIVDNYFVCLGDCDAQFSIPRELVFRYGQRIGDPNMVALGASGATLETVFPNRIIDLSRALYAMFNLHEMLKKSDVEQPMVRDVWLGNENMQLMAARDKEGTAKGLYVAAWGGHNGQSHNHNDVGNFIVFADGQPVIIDLGRPEYTRQTFSSRRYEIWAFQSQYHNLPTVNGVQQKAGGRYRTRHVDYKKTDDSAELTMDIARAYPDQAGIDSWQRAIRLDRGQSVTVSDAFQLKQPSKDIVMNYITACNVKLIEPGKILFAKGEASPRANMHFDPSQLTLKIDTRELEDENLKEVWGGRIHRLQLKLNKENEKGEIKVRFEQP